MESFIDVVIPWVDSNDPAWRADKNIYTGNQDTPDANDDSESRYRDWDTVKYLFRSIEMYMPWVRKVFFITYGHLPTWMNTSCEKLRIVKHEEYIPKQYLPTFSSHTIELNLHRIDELSEQFIYLNDDILVLKPTEETDFFQNGLPRDYAILNPINTDLRLYVQDTALTDMEVVNDHFRKKEQVKRNFGKYFSLKYGKHLYRSLCLISWPYFVGFLSKHQGNAYLKSTFKDVWDQEFELLDSTCRHKFRTRRDVNQWVMRYWQLASGNFEPIKPYGEMYKVSNNNTELYKAILDCKERTICINDNNAEEIIDFQKTKEELINILEKRFPQKSKFER